MRSEDVCGFLGRKRKRCAVVSLVSSPKKAGAVLLIFFLFSPLCYFRYFQTWLRREPRNRVTENNNMYIKNRPGRHRTPRFTAPWRGPRFNLLSSGERDPSTMTGEKRRRGEGDGSHGNGVARFQVHSGNRDKESVQVSSPFSTFPKRQGQPLQMKTNS